MKPVSVHLFFGQRFFGRLLSGQVSGSEKMFNLFFYQFEVSRNLIDGKPDQGDLIVVAR